MEPKYNKDMVPTNIQHLQVLVPGSPDPPEIWIKSVDDKEFVVEWSEPNLYGIKLDGYQVYVNDKMVGNPLSSHHRKAVIPCKPNRSVASAQPVIIIIWHLSPVKLLVWFL